MDCFQASEDRRSVPNQVDGHSHADYWEIQGFQKGSHLFNIGNLGSINKRIKKVAAMCGIKKRVSFHVSRHSWAVLALEYGMPIESVSKILGHTNITTTQIYAKVTSTKLDHDISVFESRIKGHLPAMGGMA